MFCSNCGKENFDDAVFCSYCGAKQKVRRELTDVKEQLQPEAAVNDSEGTNEIVGSGISLAEYYPVSQSIPEMVEDKRTCPNCGFVLNDSDMFCFECGTPVGQLEKADPSDRNANQFDSSVAKKIKKPIAQAINKPKNSNKGLIGAIVGGGAVLLIAIALVVASLILVPDNKGLYRAADRFAEALIAQDADKILKLTNDKKGDAADEFRLLIDTSTCTADQKAFISAVTDTMSYEIDEDTLVNNKDTASVEVVFTMVDYESVLNENSFSDINAVSAALRESDAKKEVVVELEFEKNGDDWLVSNLKDKDYRKLYSFYDYEINLVWVIVPTTEPEEVSEIVPTTEPVETTTEITVDMEYYADTIVFGYGPEVINLWSFTNEVPNMMAKYIELHPEFGEKYTVKVTIIPTDGGAYQTALDQALTGGGEGAPDIYTAEAAFIMKYSQGDMSSYAATYADLGIEDVEGKIAAGEIAQYTVDAGTRDGEVVALGYQATGGAMIYRASLAEEVFGTSDPDEIAAIFGGGSQSWDQFFEAADTLKENGISVVSGIGDLWNVVEKSTEGWVKDGALNTSSSRYEYLDMAKTLIDGGYTNDSAAWTDSWFADMKGEGVRPVFCFFGPAWLLNYSLKDNCGDTFGDWRVCTPPVGYFWGGTWLFANKDTQVKEGVAEFIEWVTLDTTEDGLQYKWANNLEDWDNDPSTGAKDAVASTVVMNMSNGEVEVCGGQNMFPAFIDGNAYATSAEMSQYDEKINQFFIDAAFQYAHGELDKDAAIEEFETSVYDNIVF